MGSDLARELGGAKKIQSPLMIPNNKGRGLTTGNLLWLRKVRFIDFTHRHVLASEVCDHLAYQSYCLIAPARHSRLAPPDVPLLTLTLKRTS